MTQYFIIMILTALLAAWIIQFLRKSKLMEKMQVNAPCALIEELLSCDFCLSWWCNVVISIVVALLLGSWVCVLMPFFGTMITRMLL